MNECIELHDSILQSIVWTDHNVVLTLNPAYIHRSEGRPAKDSGTVWLCCTTIQIEGARPGWVDRPTPIWHGLLVLGEETFEGCIPSSGTYSCAVRLQIEFFNGGSFIFRGHQITIQTQGECTFLEKFDPKAAAEDDWKKRIATVREQVFATIIDRDSYTPERLGKRLNLYVIKLEGTITEALCDGKCVVLHSHFDEDTDPFRTILQAIAKLVDEYPACWVRIITTEWKGTMVENIWIADPVYTEHYALILEEPNPYEGIASIALFFEDGAGMILFQPRWVHVQSDVHSRVHIAFYGTAERRKAVVASLNQSERPKQQL